MADEPTEDDADPINGRAGTTEEDYRWKGLSTAWALIYGFGFPLYLIATQIPLIDVGMLPGMALSALFLAWGGTVVYVIGPENVKAWRKLTEE